MPITKSAKKAVRKEEKRRIHNIGYKKKIKELKKQLLALIKEKKLKEGLALLPQYYKIVDKAAKTKTIKKNTADRKKSSIAKLLSK